MATLAEKRNAQPLPELGKVYGLRLPPEDACLTAPIWALPRPAAAAAAAAAAGGQAGPTRNGGDKEAADMDVDSGVGIGSYPWRADAVAGGRKSGGGSGKRRILDMNPGEAQGD